MTLPSSHSPSHAPAPTLAAMTACSRNASNPTQSSHIRRSTAARPLHDFYTLPSRTSGNPAGIGAGYRTRAGLSGAFAAESQRTRYGSTDNHDAPDCSRALIASHSAAGSGHRRTQSCTDGGDSNHTLFGSFPTLAIAQKCSKSRLLGYPNEQQDCCQDVCVLVADDDQVGPSARGSDVTLTTFRQRICHRLASSSWTVPVVVILTVASVFASLFALLYVTAPSLPEDIKQDLTLPRSLDQLKSLAAAAVHISHTHFPTVAGTYLVAYTFLQTFCVPGSLFMTVLGGALFPLPLALALVATCSAVGASISYLLSDAIGKPLVDKYLATRLASWSRQVAKQRHQLFNYIVFLRVAPLIPNWFINLSSPHLQVPLCTFFVATFFGVLPPSFVYARLGSSIQHLTSKDFSFWNPLNLIAIAVFCTLSAVPILVQRSRTRNGGEEDDGEYAPLTGQEQDQDEEALGALVETAVDMSHMQVTLVGRESGCDLGPMDIAQGNVAEAVRMTAVVRA